MSEALGPIGQAKADFAAGKRDAVRYADTRTRDGEIYRKTWQQCRRDAELATDSIILSPAQASVKIAESHACDEVPTFIYDPTPVMKKWPPQGPSEPPLAGTAVPRSFGFSEITLHAGEPKQKKPKPAPKDAAQLDLFG